MGKLDTYGGTCQKGDGGMCCCSCRYLAIARTAPGLDEGDVGLACIAPEIFNDNDRKVIFTNWDAHGICEMWGARSAGGES
jgi:hypothetical protein